MQYYKIVVLKHDMCRMKGADILEKGLCDFDCNLSPIAKLLEDNGSLGSNVYQMHFNKGALYNIAGNIAMHDSHIKNIILHPLYYLPNNYDFSEKIPVLFNFHGGGGYAQNFIESNDMRPIADTAQFIAVYPQGAVDYNGADPGTEPSTSWLHKAPTTHNDIYFIEAIIDTLKTLYNIDEERVYACGYSEGGIFTYELACRLNYKFAAIASVSGSMFTESYRQDYGFGPCSPLHPTAVMLIPGTSDANFHSNYNGFEPYYLSASDITNYWSTFNNTDVQPIIINVPNINQNDGSTVERNIWLNGDGCVEVLELKVINGGHDWPGSFGNMDISASEEIWRFVSKFSLQCVYFRSLWNKYF